MDLETTQLYKLAASLGFDVMPSSKNLTELALSILSRMRTRGGKHIYQSTTFSLPNFPRTALDKILPESCITSESESCKEWRLESLKDLEALGPTLFDKYGYDSAGLTRALMTASQSCIRVVATLLPAMTFTHTVAPRGVDRLHVRMQYAAPIAPC